MPCLITTMSVYAPQELHSFPFYSMLCWSKVFRKNHTHSLSLPLQQQQHTTIHQYIVFLRFSGAVENCCVQLPSLYVRRLDGNFVKNSPTCYPYDQSGKFSFEPGLVFLLPEASPFWLVATNWNEKLQVFRARGSHTRGNAFFTPECGKTIDKSTNFQLNIFPLPELKRPE